MEAAATSGEMELIIEPNVLLSGVVASPYGNGFGRRAIVNAVAIDDLGLRDLALIKIDVEGFRTRRPRRHDLDRSSKPGRVSHHRSEPAQPCRQPVTLPTNCSHIRCSTVVGCTSSVTLADIEARVVPVEDVLPFIRSLAPGTRWYGNVVAVPAQRMEEFDVIRREVEHELSRSTRRSDVDDASSPAALDKTDTEADEEQEHRPVGLRADTHQPSHRPEPEPHDAHAVTARHSVIAIAPVQGRHAAPVPTRLLKTSRKRVR